MKVAKNLDEVKTKYKKLAFLFHPERGGDTATMQEINMQYKYICDNGILIFNSPFSPFAKVFNNNLKSSKRFINFEKIMVMKKNTIVRFDWAMKYILRDKANFDVLEGFLSALLDDDKIKILHILESESNSSSESDKFNRVDLLCEDNKHRKIIIEIQNSHEIDYLERLLFGTSKVIVENQTLGEDFRNISKVISVSILYFNLGTGDDYLYYGTTEFKGMNTGNPLIVKKKVETTENFASRYDLIEKKIFPEYYLIKVERYQNIVKKKIDEWIYAIKNQEVRPEFKSRNIDKAAKKLSELGMDKTTRKKYDRFLINLAADRNMMETAKEDGVEKGVKIGREEGREEGERKAIVKVVKSSIKEGIPINVIMKITGLTKKEINELGKG